MATTTTKAKKEVKPKKVKEKRISISSFEKAAKAAYEPTTTVKWGDIEIVVTRTLPLSKVMQIIRDTVELCFTDDGEYMPEIKDFAIRKFLLEDYGNFRLPENTSLQYELIYTTDACEAVRNEINDRQFIVVIDSIERRIAHRLSIDTSRVNQQMESLYAEFAKLESVLSSTFEGIDANAMAGLIDAVQNGKLDEEKLIKSYFDEKDAHEAKPEQPELKLVETVKE